MTIPWTSPVQAAVKGSSMCRARYADGAVASRRPADGDCKARSWADDLATGRVGSVAVLARREGKVERHVRLCVARVPLTTHRLSPPRRNGAGGPYHHGACSRAALVLGRAGAAPWAALRLTYSRAGSSGGDFVPQLLLDGGYLC